MMKIPDIIDDDEDERDENDIGPFSEDDNEPYEDDDNIGIIVEDDDLEDDDIKILKKAVKDVEKFIRENKVIPKNYVKEKNKLVQEIKKSVRKLDLLLLAQAYLRKDTFSGFIRKHEELRKGLFKSLLTRMDEDAKIILLKDLLWEYSGDEEPIEFYIF